MIAFIEAHREVFGVEPICRVLPIAPATYYARAAIEWETLQWVSWYNTERLHSAIGHRPPQEREDAFHASMIALEKAA